MLMDLSRIQELLDCAVCFEPLKDKSKVLPCQHTFCKRCLKDVVRTKGCLQCPECRSVFTESNVDKLPPNVFLERLMSELKSDKVNNHDKKPQSLWKWQGLKDKQQPCVKALFDFTGTEDGDLSFYKGDTILLNDLIDENWYEGVLNGVRGVIPANFVKVTVPFPSIEEIRNQEPFARALYDFDKKDEATLLRFKKGDLITVIKRVNEDWCEGMTEDQHGIFPLNFVELNAAAEMFITDAETADEGCDCPESRRADDTMGNSNENMPATKRHTIHVDNPDELQTAQCQRNLEFSMHRSRNRDRRASETSLQESLAELSFNNSPPANNVGFSSIEMTRNTARPFRPSPDLASRLSTSPRELPNLYICKQNYEPQRPDELALQRGKLYHVTEKFQNGWFKGNRIGSKKSGTFPGNCVTKTSDRHILQRKACPPAPHFNSRLVARSTSAPLFAPLHMHSSSAPALITQLVERNGSSSSPNVVQPVQVRRERTGSEPTDPKALVRVERKKPGMGIFRNFKKRANYPSPALPPYSSAANPTIGKLNRPIPVLPSEPPPPYSPPVMPMMDHRWAAFDVPQSSTVDNRKWYQAVVSFPSKHEKELELEIGDLLYVSKKREDGWYHGKSQRTGKKGLFPSNFVEQIDFEAFQP